MQISRTHLRRTSVRRVSLLTPLPKRHQRKLWRGFLTKVKDPSDEEPSLRLEHASKEANRTPIRHTIQWWYHITDLLFWGRGRRSGKSVSSATSRRIPHNTPLLLLSVRKKSLQAWGSSVRSEWKLQDKQGSKSRPSSLRLGWEKIRVQDSNRTFGQNRPDSGPTQQRLGQFLRWLGTTQPSHSQVRPFTSYRGRVK